MPSTGRVKSGAPVSSTLYLFRMNEGTNRYFGEIEGLVAALARAGFALVKYSVEPRAFDNFYADFSDGEISLRVARDRSQFMVEGEKKLIEASGLWRAFDNQKIFEAKLLEFVQKQVEHVVWDSAPCLLSYPWLESTTTRYVFGVKNIDG